MILQPDKKKSHPPQQMNTNKRFMFAYVLDIMKIDSKQIIHIWN